MSTFVNVVIEMLKTAGWFYSDGQPIPIIGINYLFDISLLLIVYLIGAFLVFSVIRIIKAVRDDK